MTTPPGSTGPAPATLKAGVALAALENTVLLAVLIGWSGRGPVLLVAAVGFKFVLCAGTARRRAGSALTLLLWEATVVIALVGAGELHLALRLAGVLSATVVAWLVLASLHAFPQPALPAGRSRPPGR